MTADIGHNSASMTPFEAISAHIGDLLIEARNYLDGEPIANQGQADAIEKLKGDINKAIKAADEARKAENKPFDDGNAEVQERYGALIADTKALKGTAILALQACKDTLTPWLDEQARIKNEIAAEARRKAMEAEEEARLLLMEARRTGDLEKLDDAQRMAQVAVNAEKGATKLAKVATVGTGLRTTYSARIDDYTEFAKFAWTNRKPDMETLLQGLADSLVKGFGQHADSMTLPGVTIEKHTGAR